MQDLPDMPFLPSITVHLKRAILELRFAAKLSPEERSKVLRHVSELLARASQGAFELSEGKDPMGIGELEDLDAEQAKEKPLSPIELMVHRACGLK